MDQPAWYTDAMQLIGSAINKAESAMYKAEREKMMEQRNPHGY